MNTKLIFWLVTLLFVMQVSAFASTVSIPTSMKDVMKDSEELNKKITAINERLAETSKENKTTNKNVVKPVISKDAADKLDESIKRVNEINKSLKDLEFNREKSAKQEKLYWLFEVIPVLIFFAGYWIYNRRIEERIRYKESDSISESEEIKINCQYKSFNFSFKKYIKTFLPNMLLMFLPGAIILTIILLVPKLQGSEQLLPETTSTIILFIFILFSMLAIIISAFSIPIYFIGILNQYRNGELIIARDSIFFNFLKSSYYGNTQKYLYNVLKIHDIKLTSKALIIKGKIERALETNDTYVNKCLISYLKIPNVYDNMELILQFSSNHTEEVRNVILSK